MVTENRRALPIEGMKAIQEIIDNIQLKTTNEPQQTSTDDEPQYKCAICHDIRSIHPRREDKTIDYSHIVNCKCVESERALERRQALLTWCELPQKTETFTFKNYKIFPKVQEAYETALEMADGKSPKTFLTLMGPSDNGKTHLLVAICRHWLAQNKLARYAFVPMLLDELRSGFNQNGDGSYEERWKRFLNVPLLAMDDLGTESPTPWAQEHLDTLIDYRMVNGLATAVTTNLVLTDLSTRIASRLQRSGRIVIMSAPAYSKLVKANK
jgi:DNA replication protein DnaC